MWRQNPVDSKIKHSAFLDELEKIAASRSLAKDFLAGVDPTGTKTFQYAIADAPKSETAAMGRRLVGASGGLVGGAVVVPSVIYGLIGGAKNIPKGVGQVVKGFVSGAKKPVMLPIKAVKAKGILRKAVKGKEITPKQAVTLVDTFMGPVKTVAGKRSADKLKKLVRENPNDTARGFNMLPMKVKRNLYEKASTQLAKGLAMLGMGGAISGGSAYYQYGKGRSTGKILTKKQRRKITGMDDA